MPTEWKNTTCLPCESSSLVTLPTPAPTPSGSVSLPLTVTEAEAGIIDAILPLRSPTVFVVALSRSIGVSRSSTAELRSSVY
jgi:hypothetical protein